MIKTCELQQLPFLQKLPEFKKIRNRIHEPNFAVLVGVLITNVAMLCGIKEEIDHATKADLFRNIKTRCDDLSLEEIFKAFEMERYGEYSKKSNHFQLFGTDYFSEIIKKYREWRQTARTQHNIKISAGFQLPEVSESQKLKILNDGIIRCFNEFKATRKIDEPCIHIFEELLAKGFILGANTPKLIEYYDLKMIEAQNQLIAETQYQISITYSTERKDLKKILATIEDKTSNKIIVKTKKIVLQEYFTKLILQNRNIEEILNK